MAGKNNRLGSGEISNMFLTRPQPTTTDPYRRSGTKQIFQTDPQKPLIGSLSRVVEHPHTLASYDHVDQLVTALLQS